MKKLISLIVFFSFLFTTCGPNFVWALRAPEGVPKPEVTVIDYSSEKKGLLEKSIILAINRLELSNSPLYREINTDSAAKILTKHFLGSISIDQASRESGLSKERIKEIATLIGIGNRIKIVGGMIIYDLTSMSKPALNGYIKNFVNQREMFHQQLDQAQIYIQTMKKKGILPSGTNELTYAMFIALFNSEVAEEIELKGRFVFSTKEADERAKEYAKKNKLDPDIFLRILKTRTDDTDLESKLLACLPGIGIAITIWKLFGGINGNRENGPIEMPAFLKKPIRICETVLNSV